MAHMHFKKKKHVQHKSLLQVSNIQNHLEHITYIFLTCYVL